MLANIIIIALCNRGLLRTIRSQYKKPYLAITGLLSSDIFMKAVGYIRLSEKDQSRYSLDAQEAAIKEYCLKNEIDLAAVFTDNGQSSSTFNRVDFKALETYLKRNKGQIQFLVVMEHDRFSRDITEALSKINFMQKEFGIRLVSVDEPITVDPTDPITFINRAFRYVTANAELLSIKARTKRGIARARLEGRFINKAPWGYRNARDMFDKGIIIPCSREAKVVRQIFLDFLNGIPFSAILEKARKNGFTLVGGTVVFQKYCVIRCTPALFI